MILIDYHGDKSYPSLGEIGLLYIYLYGMGLTYEAAIGYTK